MVGKRHAFRFRVSEPTGGLGIRSVLSIFVGRHRRSGRDNPIAVIKSEIAFVRSLSSKKERAASGLFVAEGEKLAVGEMLASEFRVRKKFSVAARKTGARRGVSIPNACRPRRWSESAR